MTNFMTSLGDFVLQMCAFEYLCKNEFDYAITDLSKGAMTVENAQVGRSQRYKTWLPIVQEELGFYGNPTRIAVGHDAGRFLNRTGFPAAERVYHYSRNVNWRFGRRYSDHLDDQQHAAGLDTRL